MKNKSMKLSADDKKIQADIASRLKLGLPLAGLLTMLTVGCDKIPGFHTMGKTPSRHHQVMGDVPNIVPEEEETPKVDNRNNETTPKPSDNNTETLPLAGKPLPPKEDNNDNEMKKGTKTPPRLMGVPLPPKSDTGKQNEKAAEKK
ncbi:MAG: hypothetical protein LIR46_03550 [Bacteroidota bacterium]|nr:hypothetical protein [Bacteroidota bacterium]